MGSVTEKTILHVLADGTFTANDAPVIASLYDWYSAVPEVMEAPNVLWNRIKKTNNVQKG